MGTSWLKRKKTQYDVWTNNTMLGMDIIIVE